MVMVKWIGSVISFLILQFCNKTLSHFIHKESSSSIAHAISDVINALFVTNNLNYNFILFGDKNVIENYDFENSSKYISNYKTKTFSLTLSEPAVLLFSNFKKALNFARSYKLYDKLPKKLRFLIFIENFESSEFFSSFIRFSKRKFYNIAWYSYFIFENEQFVFLTSIEKFTKDACSAYQVQNLDRYVKKFKVWENDLKIEEKFKNFHACLLVQLVYTQKFSYIDPIDGKEKGMLLDIMKAVGEKGNFTPYFQFSDRNRQGGPLKPIVRNGKIIKPINLISLGSPISMNLLDSEYHVTSTTFGDVDYIFILSPPEKYTNWEKTFLPFDEMTWLFLLSTFLAAFTCVFIINHTRTFIRNLVYGQGVRFSAYNILGSFFGISQHKLPNGNFGRILLTFFIYFCLIIRTAYQSVIFEMITKDMRKNLPETINELYEQGYKIYLDSDNELSEIHHEILNTMIDPLRRPKIVPVKNIFGEISKQYKGNTGKIAFFTEDTYLFFIRNYFNVRVLKERLFGASIGLSMNKNCPLYWIIEEVTRSLVQAGIPQQMLKNDDLLDYNAIYKIKYSSQQPQVLSVDDLNVGFLIWWTSTLLSIAVFMFELASTFGAKTFNWFSTKLRNLILVYIFMMHLRDFIENHQGIF